MILVGVTGYAQAGKDTVANYLVEKYNFERVAFADPLKNLARYISEEYNELFNLIGDDAKKISKYRKLLQDLGHGARLYLGDRVWVNAAFDSIDRSKRTVISDVRYPNEFDLIWKNGGVMIRVKRDGVGPLNHHITEIGHDSIKTNYQVDNNGSLEDLFVQIDDIIGEIYL